MFVVAALASIATSPKRWDIKVDKLPAIPDPAHATRIVVEASELPTVRVRDQRGVTTILPTLHELGQQYTFLAPPGSSLDLVEFRHTCGLGCGHDDCYPTQDDFVRIASLTPVAMWRIEATSKPITTTVNDRPFPWFEIVTDASLEPTVTIVTADDINPEIHESGSHRVVLISPLGRQRPVTGTWTVHAVIEGTCPTTTPCEPPASEHLTIQSVDPKEAGFAP